MAKKYRGQADPVGDPYAYLAASVLQLAVCDLAGGGALARRAREWLSSDDEWLALWCEMAGVEPEAIRRAVELSVRK